MANASDMAYNACARIRREDTVADFPQSLLRSSVFQNIDYRDGKVGGWLYMSSGDAFATWTIQTSQDRVDVSWARRTGPASWSRVWISSGASVSVFVDQVSALRISEESGLVIAGAANPRLRCWFYPYSNNQAFETFMFTLGPNAWDSFGSLAAGTNVNLGYVPRLCRALYISSRIQLTFNLGVNFVAYARVPTTDQAGIQVDSWTSVNCQNTGLIAADILCSWSNASVTLLNP